MCRRRSFLLRLLAGALVLLACFGSPSAEARPDVGVGSTPTQRQDAPGPPPQPEPAPPLLPDPAQPPLPEPPAVPELTPALPEAPPPLPAPDLTPALPLPVPAGTPDVPLAPGAEPAPAGPVPASPEPLPVVPLASYLDAIVQEASALRVQSGRQPLVLAPPVANEALDEYLGNLIPTIAAFGRCANGGSLGIGASWEYVAARGYPFEPVGELLSCPGDDVWTPRTVVYAWLDAQASLDFLYDDFADVLACGVYDPRRNGATYQSVVCVPYRTGSPPG